MKIVFLFLSFFAPFTVFALSNIFPDSCNTVLWGIINGKGDTSYLFGTFHEFGNSYFDTYIPLRDKYLQANCVATESAPPRLKYTRVNITENWVKKLSKADKLLIKNFLKSINSAYTLKNSRNLPPSFLAYILLSELAIKVCDTWNENDVVLLDEYIINGTFTFNIKLYGLESADDTFNVKNIMMGSSSNEDKNSIIKLKDIIINTEKYRDEIKTECWLADDYKNLKINYKFSKPSVSEDSNFVIFLDARNNYWMPKVKNIVDSNKAFIAVGLKHLFFKNGLIMQLADAGYKVFPVEMYKSSKPLHYLTKYPNKK